MKEERIKELVRTLTAASAAYYNGQEIMSNFEYDRLYDELVLLEKETGIIEPDSPTQNVGAPILENLAKSTHEYPALSLDKTKDIDLFVSKYAEFEKKSLSDKTRGYGEVLMWKMDGSTVQITYQNGRLQKAVTRGNGTVGSVITHNAQHIIGIPQKIDFNGTLVVRGEAVMSYSEFNRLNANMSEEEQYANPRNLANATISMLDANEAAEREIQFFAFNLVYTDASLETPEQYPYPFGPNAPGKFLDSFEERLLWLKELGFQCVPYEHTTSETLKSSMQAWEKKVDSFDFPVDGLVAALDNTVYAAGQPGTGHNPHISQGYAFKWKDETAETTLREIEWSLGKTGVLTPVAVFDPVELEGTTVSRASVHNAGYVMQYDLKIGDRISVFKANKIIPQIAENIDCNDPWDSTSDEYPSYAQLGRNHIPEFCPCCGMQLTRDFSRDNTGRASDTFIVYCSNPECSIKKLRMFEHFVDRDCMDIVGLSSATLEKMLGKGWISEFVDLYYLSDPVNRDILQQLTNMDGFGEKSVQKLLDSIENSRKTDFISFVHALSIPNIGKGQAKLLKNWILQNYRKTYAVEHETVNGKVTDSLFDALCILVSEHFDFTQIDGFGKILADSLTAYMQINVIEPSNPAILNLLEEIEFTDTWTEISTSQKNDAIAGKTFVITGKINHFKNREELQALIESLGGKAAGSVSKNTDYLINNDKESQSGKNKKAKELGVRIISEEDFLGLAEIL